MTRSVITITGATGGAGSELVRALNAAGVPVRLAVRSPERAAALCSLHPDNVAVPFSYEARETHAPALDGASRVFLVAPDSPDQAGQTAAFIDEAARRGVHIVKLSGMGAEREDAAPLSRWNRDTERYIESKKGAYTFLRPNVFMQNFLRHYLVSIRDQGVYASPSGDSGTSYIDARDIAAAARRVLTEPGHEGKAYTLTGPRSLSGAEVAAIFTAALGRPIRFVDVPEEAALGGLRVGGVPEIVVDAVGKLFAATKRGEFSLVSPDLPALLGREPISFERFAQDHAPTFTPTAG